MIVTHSNLGRLGNALFEIAAVVGIAREHGADYVLPPWFYAPYFAHSLPQSDSPPPAHVVEQQGFHFEPVHIVRDTTLAGYFQSEKFFLHCAEEIRRLFTPAAVCRNYLRDRYPWVLDTTTCSVHVRHGDYVWQPCHHPVLPLRYYRKAFAQFDPETLFVVFSDNMPWCRRHFRGANFRFIEGESDIVDLFLMSACRHHIIANSSFSWWGAWLSPDPRKRVISPSHTKWFGPKYRALRTTDLLPPEWVQIDFVRPHNMSMPCAEIYARSILRKIATRLRGS